MKTNKDNSVLIILVIFLVVIIVLLLGFLFVNKDKFLVTNVVQVQEESLTWVVNEWNWSGWVSTSTWIVQSFSLDNHIQDIDDTNIDTALTLALKRYNENGKKDIGDYEQLMYIYIDKWNYKEVISLWNKALEMLKENNNNEIWVNSIILSQLIQAYIYDWYIDKAWELIKNNENLDIFIEKIMYEYKKSNFKYIIDNSKKLEEYAIHDLFWLILLAKAYKNEKDLNNSLKIYEEIFKKWKDLAKKDSIFEAYYCYYSSYILINEFNKNLDEDKIKYYTEENNFYKNRIDNKEKIEYTDSKTDLYYNPDLMYFNIDRIMNF